MRIAETEEKVYIKMRFMMQKFGKKAECPLCLLKTGARYPANVTGSSVSMKNITNRTERLHSTFFCDTMTMLFMVYL